MRLIRATILGEPTERMASILKEDAVHFTETTGKEYAGREAVIERFRFVQENTNHEYFVHTATLTEIKGGEALRYDVGKRCLVLACDDPDNLDAILFVDTDEAGDIAAIYISRDPRYTFKIDLPPERKNILDDLPFHDSYREAMLARASFHDFIEREVAVEDITSDEILDRTDSGAARMMLEKLPQGEGAPDEELLKKLFGYMFAKAIENAYAGEAAFESDDAWEGRCTSALDAGGQKLLETAMKYGRQFYTDFELHTAGPEEDGYEEELEEALIFVMCLGAYCSAEYMGRSKQEEGE